MSRNKKKATSQTFVWRVLRHHYNLPWRKCISSLGIHNSWACVCRISRWATLWLSNPTMVFGSKHTKAGQDQYPMVTFKSPPLHLACSDVVPCTNLTFSDIELLPAQGRIISYPFCWNAYGEISTLAILPVYCLAEGFRTRFHKVMVISVDESTGISKSTTGLHERDFSWNDDLRVLCRWTRLETLWTYTNVTHRERLVLFSFLKLCLLFPTLNIVLDG